jgi:hypothetical protein
MRKLIAAIGVAGAAIIAGPAVGADLPEYPPIIEIPDVDYGVEGSFYLRGSAAGNWLWSKEARAYECLCVGGYYEETVFPFVEMGYGYSVGAGFGFETGTGLRFDATIDHIGNEGLEVTKGAEYGFRSGDYSVKLRSTLALANAYYDFSFSDYGYGAAGGAFGYVGAGAGVAFNHVEVSAPAGIDVPSGKNTSLAAAGMVGVGYDFGAIVADVGYRGVYISELSNSADEPNTVWSDKNWLHEVRSTLRYRF